MAGPLPPLRPAETPAIERLPPGVGEPCWLVPVEMVLSQLDGSSSAFIMRAYRMGATFRRTAVVWLVGERLLGRIDFVGPVGPENWCEQVVKLTAHMWESLG